MASAIIVVIRAVPTATPITVPTISPADRLSGELEALQEVVGICELVILVVCVASKDETAYELVASGVWESKGDKVWEPVVTDELAAELGVLCTSAVSGENDTNDVEDCGLGSMLEPRELVLAGAVFELGSKWS